MAAEKMMKEQVEQDVFAYLDDLNKRRPGMDEWFFIVCLSDYCQMRGYNEIPVSAIRHIEALKAQ